VEVRSSKSIWPNNERYTRSLLIKSPVIFIRHRQEETADPSAADLQVRLTLAR
jgi:hypothetical protein